MSKGPVRIIQSSYGFLRNEPYQPKVYKGHREGEPELDDVDGEEYLETIVYFMKKVWLLKLSSIKKPQVRAG